jgi:DNA-binding beta-propeller fold protein YncE
MNKKRLARLALVLTGAFLVLAACAPEGAQVVVEDTPTPTETPRPTHTPGPSPTPFIRPTVETRGIPSTPGVGSFTEDLGSPLGFLAIDEAGNLYVTEYKPDGHVLKINSDGKAEPVGSATFNCPYGIVIGKDGTLYVSADSCGGGSVNAIYTLTPDGKATLFAGSETEKGLKDGQGAEARFNRPAGLGLGADGTLYVADYGNYAVRSISPDGEVKTFAGTGKRGYADGPAAQAQFASPIGLTFGPDDSLYVTTGCDENECDPQTDLAHFVRVIKPDGTVATYSGKGAMGPADGPHTFSQYDQPGAIVFTGPQIAYVADTHNNCIRRLTATEVRVYASVCRNSTKPGGTVVDGKLANAVFSWPIGLVYDGHGHLFVSDYGFHRIRVITLKQPDT